MISLTNAATGNRASRRAVSNNILNNFTTLMTLILLISLINAGMTRRKQASSWRFVGQTLHVISYITTVIIWSQF
jgi:hypothetical protein